ncbi:MAG: hypothetical protein ACRD82_02345 [Blastocatellia bacterium]
MARKGDLKSEFEPIDGLTARETKAIEALLIEPSVKDAAKNSGVSYTQLRRWLAEPVFSDAYRRARTVVFENTLAGLQSVTTEAIETLRAIMTDKQTASSVRVAAARTLLESAFKSRDVLDTETRLVELEARFLAASQSKQ